MSCAASSSGRSGAGIATEGGQTTGVAVGWVSDVVVGFSLSDGAHGQDGGGLVGGLADLEELGDADCRDDEYDGA